MIKIVLPGLKKPPLPYTPPSNARVTNVVTSIMQEAKDRDEIVRKLFRECPYTKGDVCVTQNEQARETYGDCTIIGVLSTYGDMKKEKWPESNNPLIVTAQSSVDDTIFHCTTNFLRKKV